MHDVRALTATEITGILNEYHNTWLAEQTAWDAERAKWSAALASQEEVRAALEKETAALEIERALLKEECIAHDTERATSDEERTVRIAALAGQQMQDGERMAREPVHDASRKAWAAGAAALETGLPVPSTGTAEVQRLIALHEVALHELEDRAARELAEVTSSHADATMALKAEHEAMLRVIVAEKGLELYQSCGGRRWCSKHWKLLSPRPEIQDHLVASGARQRAAAVAKPRRVWWLF